MGTEGRPTRRRRATPSRPPRANPVTRSAWASKLLMNSRRWRSCSDFYRKDVTCCDVGRSVAPDPGKQTKSSCEKGCGARGEPERPRERRRGGPSPAPGKARRKSARRPGALTGFRKGRTCARSGGGGGCRGTPVPGNGCHKGQEWDRATASTRLPPVPVLPSVTPNRQAQRHSGRG